ncbi:MAG: tetratricopeptide repeat protein [Verrucomicrobiota bacterium]
MTPSRRKQHLRLFLALGLLSSPVIPAMSPAQAQPPQATPVQNPSVEDLLAYADLLFSREQYTVAAQQYQTFIRENENSPNLQRAWFRLGECYLKVNQTEDAIASFNFLINEFRTGPFVGSAAYRLAVLRLNEQDYRNALSYFKVARDQLTDKKAKHLASFYYARCLQLTQQPKEALAEFRKVIDAFPQGENPYYERGLLETARLQFDLGDTEKALKSFEELAETATNQEYKEEATVRGGLLAAEAGQTDLSVKLLNRALKFSDTSPWKNLAQVGAIFNAFSAGDYDRVIGLYNTGAYTSPDASRAKMLLIVGHSFRIKGDLDSAIRLYSLVEGKFPEREEGIEAGYRKLQILHQQASEILPEAARQFAERQQRVDPDSEYVDMAWLMAGEWHFGKAQNSASGPGSEYAVKQYKDAAAAYKKVRLENIDEKYRESALYKTGWSEIESGNLREGILTLSRFIQKHSDSSYASSALAKRAVAYQTQEDHEFALGDFQDIAKRYPDAPEVEFALQQIALIYAHQRKIPEMINAYNELLRKFPETNGAGEAHYWIGVGYFDLEQHQQAIPELEKARNLDAEYDDQATLRLVICHYHLENINELATEAKHYINSAPKEGEAQPKKKRPIIPLPVLTYLGQKLAAAKEYETAEFFLEHVSTPDAPAKTSANIWRLLAESRMALKRHADAIPAFDHYLVQTERPSDRATAYLQRGYAQLCLQEYDSARNSAQESLRSQKEGRTNAEARLLLGDVAAATGNLEEAAREYLVVSQIFMDREITPKALTKAVQSYQSLGNREKAQQLQQQLTAQFPDYKAPKDLDYEC